MVCTYRVRKDTMHDEERKAHTVYGIEAVSARRARYSPAFLMCFLTERRQSALSVFAMTAVCR